MLKGQRNDGMGGSVGQLNQGFDDDGRRAFMMALTLQSISSWSK
jgi:hypothetical protein